MQGERHLIAVDAGSAGHDSAVGADLHVGLKLALHRRVQHLQAVGGDLVDLQRLPRTDGDRAGGGVHVGDVARLAVFRRHADVQSLALADRVLERAVVLFQLVALGVFDHAGAHADRAAQKRLGVAVGDEADVVGIRLGRSGEPVAGRLLADLRLFSIPYREDAAVQLVAREHAEHVGLVFLRVGGSAEVSLVVDNCVVPGGDRVEAQGHRAVEQCRELDLLVAAQARVGGLAVLVGPHEVVDDLFFKAVREVPHVKRDTQVVAHAARVGGVLQGTAAAGRLARLLRVLAQCKVHADNVVARLHQARSSDRGVHSPAHGRQYSHVGAV